MAANIKADDEQINRVAEERVQKDIDKGVQTIQYQVVTLMTTNGQAPFITVFMYLDEAPEGQDRSDLAMVIRSILKQRILGVKNEKGIYVTPAFPKLIYVLDEDNITEDSPFCGQAPRSAIKSAQYRILFPTDDYALPSKPDNITPAFRQRFSKNCQNLPVTNMQYRLN